MLNYILTTILCIIILVILGLFIYECKYKILRAYVRIRNNIPKIFLEYARFAEGLGAGVAAFTLVEITRSKTELTNHELWFIFILGVLIFEVGRYIKKKFG